MVTWFRRGDLPEPPPSQVIPLGMAPGYRVVEHDDPEELDRGGRAAGVSASDTWNGHKIASYVNNADQTVHLLSRKATNDDTGKGWDGTPDAWGRINMALALQKMAQTDQAKTDPAASAVQVAKNLSQPSATAANDDQPTTAVSTGGTD